MRRRQALWGAVALTALLLLYVGLALTRAVALVRTGEPVGVALGAAIAILPLLALWFVAVEWRLAATVQAMADELAQAGRLPVDDLPRSPGGRVDRAVARERFAAARAAAEAAGDDDWAALFDVAFAYEAAGDKREARATLRRAAALYRARGARRPR